MSSANIIPLVVCYHLAGIRCATCRQIGCAIVALQEGELPRFWCSVDCARPAGWPWLKPPKLKEAAS